MSVLVPSEGCRGESDLSLSPNIWWYAGNSWHPSASRYITLTSAFSHIWLKVPECMSVSGSKHPLFIRTPVTLDQDPT